MKKFLCLIISAVLILTSCNKNLQDVKINAEEITIETPQTTTTPETSQTTDDVSETQRKRIFYDALGEDNYIRLYSPIILSEIDWNKLEQCKTLDITLEEETDLSFLEGLDNLEKLFLNEGRPLAVGYKLGERYITSYDFLSKIKNLKLLRIGSGNNKFDISSLNGMDYLEDIGFSGLKIVNTNDSVFENITHLAIGNCGYLFEDIAAAFPNVKTLFVHNGYIDFYEVISLKDLKEIKLSYAAYTGLEALASLANLESLDIVWASPIEGYDVDYSCLLELTSLKKLSISHNTLTDEQIEEFERLNPECEVVVYSGA